MKRFFSSNVLLIIVALAFVGLVMLAGYRAIGLPPVVIVGGSGLIGAVLWARTYLQRPAEPALILPLFLLTVAGLEIHMTEEYLTGFGPAMSRLFDISWTERGFLLVFAFFGPTLYTLTALGLLHRMRLAGFVAWFIFIGPGVAEFTHFIFPAIQPAIHPELLVPVSQTVSNGHFVANMPNYYHVVTGTYYFPGLWTAILPMLPGIYAIYRLLEAHRVAPSR